jgi:zinc transport system substrate-binding protein
MVYLALFFGLHPLNTWAMPVLKVQVSILPQKYFVEAVGGDRVRVDVLVKPGKSPATYSPSPDQIRRLASSQVYFRIGVAFENGLLEKINAISGLKVVDTRQGIKLRTMGSHLHEAEHPEPGRSESSDHHAGAHGRGDESDGKDPHIWMSPVLVKQQAHTIYRTLADMDPEGGPAYQKNYHEFIRTLDELDLHLKTVLKDLNGENLFVFHPSFGYFTDQYELKQVAVESMGKAPKGKELSRMIKQAKKENARVIFVQPQFDRNAAVKIASAIKGAVVSIDPLAYDYLGNMENMAQVIARELNR